MDGEKSGMSSFMSRPSNDNVGFSYIMDWATLGPYVFYLSTMARFSFIYLYFYY
jgi:hypothetical protein